MLRFVLLLGLLAFGLGAQADVFKPAYLELREVGQDRYELLWKIPMAGGGLAPSTLPRLPADAQVSRELSQSLSGGHVLRRWQIQRAGGLAGQTIHIDGLMGGATDVIVRLQRLDGSSQTERLTPERSSWKIAAPSGAGEVAWAYLVLGFEHILGGLDHLLFVSALLLIVRGRLRLLATVTAFTLAHSITLAAASLGLLRVPGPPVEACIALSIVFMAAELVHSQRGRIGLTERAPWLVAFGFGLLHGLGFAGALAEVGLPQEAIAIALLMFNVGVELGQLVFVALLLLLAAGLAWLRARIGWPAWLQLLPAYGIGAVAMMWTLQRVLALPTAA